ncbi:DNA-binding protein [uncultured Desulfuromusa sp.]|uniref:DNA-binding protein n=1 Tax=uncultured Desulfuromusa sp. TaxID=219183 RepID=UPI002AA8FFEC|nr:Mu transposase C-terminal domain-containing protein [uncultured Desulfuromusa sp.]
MANLKNYTAKELAGLPGLPKSQKGVIARAKSKKWPRIRRNGKGGGYAYPLTALPQETQDHLLKITLTGSDIQTVSSSDTDLVETTESQLPTMADIHLQLAPLKTWQQQTMDARLAFIRLIEKGAMDHGVTRTIKTIVQQIKDGHVPQHYLDLLPVANARSGGKTGKRTLSYRTLMRWWSDYKNSGGNYANLAPATVEKNTTPAWAPYLLDRYRVGSKISLARALELLPQDLPSEIDCPSYSQANNFIKKFSRLDIQKGRKSGSELRGQRLYRTRDASMFFPLDIVSCDGHSFKARVAHPAHGRPFKPEVCAVIDYVTHAVIGWSAGLAESHITVADALRHAITSGPDKPLGGLPLIFYADNGAGNTATVNTDEVAGLYARCGIQFETGRPGNPQGRGLVERLNASLWIPAAKQLPTYCGKDMDSLVARNVYLQLQKDVRQAKREGTDVKSELMISWPDFLLFLETEVDAYNHRPHSALPRIKDPKTKRRRNMTPAELWIRFLADGWKPETLTEQEIGLLFRPHEMCKCVRGIVTLHKKTYADPALEHYHGQQLMVGYDIHDPSKVWVRDGEGRLIVIAKLDANKSPVFPVARVEQLREQRHKNRSKTLAARQEEIDLERGVAIDIAPQTIEIAADVIETSDRIISRIEQKKKVVASAWERYIDIEEREKAGQASDYELQWKTSYEQYTETGKRSGIFKLDEFCLHERGAKRSEL